MSWQPRSDGERRVDKALKLTHYEVLHEYGVGNRLRLDFYIKSLNLGIEVHGDQHYRPNSLFYEDAEARKAALARDEQKAELCKEQGITLLVLAQKEVMAASSPQVLLDLIFSKFKEALSAEKSSSDEW